MLIQPIDYFLVIWFGLALTSTAYVVSPRRIPPTSGWSPGG